LSVSSVSSGGSSSVWWEEYIEKLKKLQQQTVDTGEAATPAAEAAGSTGAVSRTDLRPDKILAELQTLEGDPEKLKARASELATQVTSEAEKVDGKHGNMLKELASDLEAIAVDGDLSAMKEKVARGAGAGPSGARGVGPSGMSGGTGASIKWIEALVEEEDDEDEHSFVETLEEYLAELKEKSKENSKENDSYSASVSNSAQAATAN
jgi:hypothetical protein